MEYEDWGDIIRTPAELACELKALQKAQIIGYKIRPNADGNVILEYRATEEEVDRMYAEFTKLMKTYNDGIKYFVI